jgi:DNA-binding response OmpR family regulator
MTAAPARPRLLLVEDHDAMRMAVARCFRVSGWDVDSEPDAAGGIEAARSGRDYAAAVVDLMLPDRPGAAVVRAIREARDPCRVVVYTACLPRSALVLDAIAAGCDAVVYKPTSFVEMLLPVVMGDPGEEPV